MNARNLLAGIWLAIPFAVWADQGDLPTRTSGPYLGIGVGYSKIDARNDQISISGEDFSYRLLGGYRFAHLPLPFDIDVGIEAAYVDLGEVDEFTLGSDVAVEMDGFVTSGVVYLPVFRNLDVFGKTGVYFWDGTVKADSTEIADESSTDLSLGLGIAWQTGGALGAQLEIESLNALDGVWIATLSATYQFK